MILGIFITFVDDFSSNVWVYFLKKKYEVFTKFKLWKVEVEYQIGREIKYLWLDNRTKYTGSNFKRFRKVHTV